MYALRKQPFKQETRKVYERDDAQDAQDAQDVEAREVYADAQAEAYDDEERMSESAKPVGAAMQVLIDQVKSRLNAEVEQLAAIALKDAGLDPAEGWRFDFFNAAYVNQAPAPAATE